MITKITRGTRVGDIAAYLHGPGKHNEHVLEDGRTPGGSVIASNIAANGDRDGAYWAPQLRQAHQHRPDIGKPIWQCSIRAADTDPIMDAAEWGRVAQEFAEGMGFEQYPWVAVKHGPDHIHVVVSRVHEDPAQPVWLGRNDRWTAQQVRRGIEQAHGLAQAPIKTSPATRRGPDHQLKQGEWQRAAVTGQVPERVRLAAMVNAAAETAAGQGREGFEAAIEAQGVLWRANQASTGRMNGYSFALNGHQDSDGQPVWFKASGLDKNLSWARLAPFLTPAEQTAAPNTPTVKPARRGLFRKAPDPPASWVQPALGQTVRPDDPGQIAAHTIETATAWWSQRHQAVTATVGKAWAAARPTAWSDLDPEVQRVMRTQAASFEKYQARVDAMQREDTIRAAERGDQAAIDTVRGWVGERVPERGLATAARAYNTQQQTAQESATRRAAHQPTTQPAPAVSRPPLTPGVTPDQRRGRGR